MNYLLDTCIISELVRPKPDPRVVKWIQDRDESTLHLSVITIGEIQKGIARLPDSRKKKQDLQEWLTNDLCKRFEGRILSFSLETAKAWGLLMAEAEGRGVVLPAIDSLIAAQGRHHGMTVVTRNTSDMASSGVGLFNPWGS